ncbi:RsmB/NOP family class I SAM-dependent RNA methyltransferase [Roseofilum capinflatum]|uniref:RsmB/NOP family class I SAM-dependent RNA methyltransferase n=1 Tax=Roseofilum capinflatum BLCC-M114 TaxID=3022440 RepID=A0ABT7B4N7_9CYAN|nr:RsmB/NOP family class I SAM-dependent RNA methyltransferase [Roseofilum capinflatum]MDJ1174133.1 RsmB/NOP family class I SAM-dependent RNA methyltransferase [Roseofilum capinflatum BLCC-M114]
MSSKLLKQFSDRLWNDPQVRDQFIQAFDQPPPLHPCILWCQDPPLERPFAVEPPQPWQPDRVDRLSLGAQPGKHPAHDRGAYYCLDFSSVFAASPLLQLSDLKTAIDVCAAPGGKSLFTWHILQPDLLLCNEVVGKRLGTLMANLRRCHVSNFVNQQPGAIATQLDPHRLAQHFPQAFQLVLIDAPCSGQSLLLKHKQVPGCFHKVTRNRNANRQKRIIGNSAQLVAPQGYLLYMTCTYSLEENEQVCHWLLKKYPHFQPIPVPHLLAYQSHLTDLPCYRLWPHQGLGAGAFTALFQNQNLGEACTISLDDLATINRL